MKKKKSAIIRFAETYDATLGETFDDVFRALEKKELRLFKKFDDWRHSQPKGFKILSITPRRSVSGDVDDENFTQLTVVYEH